MRRFIGKLVLYMAIVAAAQALVAVVIRPRLFPATGSIDAATDIVLCGDSTSYFTAPDDVDGRRLPEILSDRLDGRRVSPVVHNAFHLRVYEACARRVAASRSRPRLMVVPINLRSLSPTWYLRPGWQFEERIRVLKGRALEYYLISRPLAVFKVALGPSEKDFLATPVYDGDRRLGTVGQFSEMGGRMARGAITPGNRRDWISYLYLYRLRPDHPLLEALRGTVTSLQEAGVAPVVYVTPIDHETATSWYGPEFRDRVAANVAVIQKVLAKSGASAIDMSLDLGAGGFCYGIFPNEHLRDTGRLHVARRIAEAVNALDD